MDAESVREEVRALLAQCHNAVDEREAERTSVELSTRVMEEAFPGEVVSIDSLRHANGRTACEYTKKTAFTVPQFERAGFIITERGVVILDALKAV